MFVGIAQASPGGRSSSEVHRVCLPRFIFKLNTGYGHESGEGAPNGPPEIRALHHIRPASSGAPKCDSNHKVNPTAQREHFTQKIFNPNAIHSVSYPKASNRKGASVLAGEKIVDSP